MIFDIDRSQVELDRAAERGLLGYPDVLGKRVQIEVPSDGSPTRYQHLQGVVSAVGPIGLVLRMVQNEYHDPQQRLTYRSTQPTRDGDELIGSVTTYTHIPWSLALVSWSERTEVPTETRPTETPVVGASPITQEMLDAATGDELDRLAQEIGANVRNAFSPHGINESDAEYRNRLRNELQWQPQRRPQRRP